MNDMLIRFSIYAITICWSPKEMQGLHCKDLCLNKNSMKNEMSTSCLKFKHITNSNLNQGNLNLHTWLYYQIQCSCLEIQSHQTTLLSYRSVMYEWTRNLFTLDVRKQIELLIAHNYKSIKMHQITPRFIINGSQTSKYLFSFFLVTVTFAKGKNYDTIGILLRE